MKGERSILYFKDYFLSFYRTLSDGAQKKFDYSLAMLKIQERVSEKWIPKKDSENSRERNQKGNSNKK